MQSNKKIWRLVVCMPFFALLSACAATFLPTNTIQQSQYGGYDEQQFMVIRTPDRFQRLLTDLQIETAPVNFETSMVLAAFLGERNTGGYAIRIVTVQEVDEVLQVTIEIAEPGPADNVTQALTAPFHVVSVPVSDKPVRVVYQQESHR